MQRKKKPKPCPFCGGTQLDDRGQRDGNPMYCYGYVSCSACRTQGPALDAYKHTKEEWIELWNRRKHDR